MKSEPNSELRREDPAIAKEIQRQLDAIDWPKFNEAVARRTAPIVRAYADARFRSLRRIYRRPPFKAAA